MKQSYPILKRCAIYSLMLMPVACLQQEIRPDLDKNTGGCLIRQQDEYAVDGSTNSYDFTKNPNATWHRTSRFYHYNLDGNPDTIRFTFSAQPQRDKILTMEYNGLRLLRINQFLGTVAKPDGSNRNAYKTLEISPDFALIVEHTFTRDLDRNEKDFKETLTLVHEFFRTKTQALKVKKTENVKPEATLNNVKDSTSGLRLGTYWRSVYDDNNENVIRRVSKDSPKAAERTIISYGGYDLNSKNYNGANFWLSYVANFGVSFEEGEGLWNENNITLLGFESAAPFVKFTYELNEAGFPCFSSSKRATNEPDISQTYYYYYNCNCR